MEKINEMGMSELVDTSIMQPQINFDFQARGFSKEREEDILVMKYENNEADAKNILIKGRNFKRLKQYCKETGNEEVNFKDCIEEVFDANYNTSKKYIQAYEVLIDIEKKVPRGTFEKILKLGVHKISYLYKIPEEPRLRMIEEAPLDKLNMYQVKDLSNEVKKTGDYSEKLVEEIRKKDEKIADSEQKQKQMQQEKEQKDNEIMELRAKIQELEQAKVSPVEKVEPEVIEKVVEVEKVVEKEVIPDYIQDELEKLRKDNKFLEEDNSRKTNFINKQSKELIDKQKAFDELKMNEEQSGTYVAPNFVNVGILLSTMDTFIKSVAGYSYLDKQYDEISNESRRAIFDGIISIRKWCDEMEKTLNTIHINSDTIIIESED